MQSELIINVHDLLRRPGSRKEVIREVKAEGYAVSAARVPEGEPIHIELLLESLANAGTVRITGTIKTNFEGECRRCLEAVQGVLEIEVDELFSDSETVDTDEDVWPLEGNEISITEVVRENLFLALPLSPLCANACRGPVPDEYPAVLADESPVEDETSPDDTPADPRWAALRALHFD